jgi:hypothetical protein
MKALDWFVVVLSELAGVVVLTLLLSSHFLGEEWSDESRQVRP